jgi:hypothetical protein
VEIDNRSWSSSEWINAFLDKKEVGRSLRGRINDRFAEKRERTVVEKADQSPFWIKKRWNGR